MKQSVRLFDDIFFMLRGILNFSRCSTAADLINSTRENRRENKIIRIILYLFFRCTEFRQCFRTFQLINLPENAFTAHTKTWKDAATKDEQKAKWNWTKERNGSIGKLNACIATCSFSSYTNTLFSLETPWNRNISRSSNTTTFSFGLSSAQQTTYYIDVGKEMRNLLVFLSKTKLIITLGVSYSRAIDFCNVKKNRKII